MTVRDEPYRVEAYNSAKGSENKIHDDNVASRFGFSGGLVPGADVYAYMAHAPIERWGRPFLERGRLEARFVKPIFDGEVTTVKATEVENGLTIEVESRGDVCAIGRASLLDVLAPPALSDFKGVMAVEERLPADEVSLKPGTWLGMRPLTVRTEAGAQYLADVRETNTIYAKDGLIHPGLLVRALNWTLIHNVVLGPWIHVGSKTDHFAIARIGDDISVRAKVVDNYNRKGHRFVSLDGLVVANGTTPVARVFHTVIYQLRQVADA